MFTKTLITAILGFASTLVNAIPTTISTNNDDISTRDAAVGNAKMTWYYPGLGACGQFHGDGDMVMAVDPTVYGTNNAPICNKRMRVNYQGRSIVLTVVDKCPSCPPNGLDLTPAAWRQLVGSTDLGPQYGSWDFI
ncbi:RlpA-like double-psi beta-barrel-containing domain containing protein [Rhypophila sp. PSN 637]